MAEATSQLNILVKVRDEAGAAMSRLSNDVSDLGGSLNFAGMKAGLLAGALAAIASATILSAIKAFAESEVQMARFNAIIKTLPPNLQVFRDRILEIADTALSKFGFSNEAAALSIAKLLQATGNADFAFKAFQAAMDLARFKGMGLDEATQALIISFQGGGRMLKQFGIDVDEHASKETILAAVIQKVQGQAEAYTTTFSGQLSISKELLGEFMEALGGKFVPIIQTVNGWVLQAIEKFGGWVSVIRALQPLITFLALFLAGVFIVSMIAAVGSVLTMIGVGASLIGTIALIALVLTAFITFWQLGWETVKTAFQTAWGAISNIFSNIWGSIRGAFDAGINFMRSQLQGLVDFFNFVVGLVTAPIKKASEGISNVLGQAIGSVRGILGLQEGGIVTRPTLAVVAEGGQPEAIIPLSRLNGAGGGITINLSGTFYTSTEVAENFANEIARIIKNQLNLAIRA